MNHDEPSERFLELTAQEILERTAFIWTELATSQVAWSGGGIGASLDFSGPGRGRVELLVSERLAVTVAANMLGIEPEAVEQGDPEQAVGELLNILTGALAVQVFGRHAVCALGIPVARRLETPELPPGATTAAAFISEDGELMELALFLSGNP